MVKLQLALDFVDLDKAMEIAEEVAQYVDIMEAGTPLIKAEGSYAISELKTHFHDQLIAADMKTMDAGALEAALAAEAGADFTTVCAAADDETIKAAIAEGKKRKIKVVVDTISTPPERWKQVDSLDPDYICLHVGIDQQRKGMDPLELLKGHKLQSPLIIAGGINAKRILPAMKAKAHIIIVGSAITKAPDPKKAAKEISQAMDAASKQILLYGKE